MENGKRAIRLLEQEEEHWWQGKSYFVLGITYMSLGEFALALEAGDKVYAIGESIGDQRLQTYASWLKGWIYAMQGEYEAAIEACRWSLERSPDPVNTADALSILGYAHLEKGDPVEAIPPLEQAVQLFSEFRFRQDEGWFSAILSEAFLEIGQLDRAQALARQALEITSEVRALHAVGHAQRALGRIALASGAIAEAETHFQEALQTLDSTQARYEVGRTHLELAKLAHAQGNNESAAAHLSEAHALFKELQVPKWTERAAQLSDELGVSLAEGK